MLYLGFAGRSSLAGLLVGGFFVGIGGTAISALTTVKLVKNHGFAAPFVLRFGRGDGRQGNSAGYRVPGAGPGGG